MTTTPTSAAFASTTPTPTTALTSYFWLPRPKAPSPGPQWQPLSDNLYWESAKRAPDQRPLFAPIPDWADDLERVARAVFAADRCTSRDAEFDRWTRRLRLSVPVTEPDAWRRALPHLSALLTTLTGDRWELEFRPIGTDCPDKNQPLPLAPEGYAGEVALFSGGLDSLGWLAQRSAASDPRTLLLVSFPEGNLGRMQKAVYEAVERRSKRPLRLIELSQNVRRPKGFTKRMDRTTRSRGLLYTATAVSAAAAEQVPVVHLPENGQLALNPPLSAARSGACSTRSVHPWTLHHLNRVIAEIANPPESAVRIVNPFASLTKGEVCKAAQDTDLPQSVLESTVSCGASPVHRPGPVNIPHCGLCFPCLVRRSGLLHVYGEDGTQYAAHPWNTSLPPDLTKHWRALQRWLEKPFTVLDLIADTPLPPDAKPAEMLEVVERGREELRALVSYARTHRHTA
ncbi:7-cyano-7-deazaguanine synthase [Streptomyces sp. NPDC021093]|uniref:7-cyano-7-deazaguanine synthase n=1 Tax=Streptomyces sp. NPDC021093 TaxID=3365112 RepID=UPI0037B354A6